MDSRDRDRLPSADGVDFVRFCYRRRPVGWPDLYDEMCAVANRGLYRGWGTEELSAEGIRFTLWEMPALAALVGRVVAEEHERRRAVRASAGGAPEGPRARGAVGGETADRLHHDLRLAGSTAGV